MNIPENLRYTKTHEWAKIEGSTALVGITDYAQGELGDIVFVELPSAGTTVTQFESCASIEAVKAVSDLYAPLSGSVLEVNNELAGNPTLINQDPYAKGWILKIQLSSQSEIEGLMLPAEYKKLVE